MRNLGVFMVFIFVFLAGCGSAPQKKDEPVERSSVRSTSARKNPSANSMKGKCRKGDYQSCYKYGLRFYLGKKVSKDYKKAGRFFVKACKGDYIRACYALGVMFKNGKGTSKDCKNADKYFEKACDNGHEKACTKMWTCQNEPERSEYDDYEEYDDYNTNDDYEDESGYSDENDWDQSDDGWDDF
jgi:TPR repeat protein